uniref:RNase H type-1 domain-containing protein n=1 Tax=Oryza rufipogon TaxID=4529 RepID=A0A0E0RC44_ORYRU
MRHPRHYGKPLAALASTGNWLEWIPMAVEVETDCATILGRLTTKGARSRWTFLFRATKKVMAFLQEVCLLHCERECNRIAHEFAQLGKRSAQSTDYFSPFAVNNMQNLLL